jgi:Rho GTPase-activating protein RGD1
VTAWQSTMRVHEMMAENRLRFSQRLHEMSDELAVLAKEVDKNRKQVRFTKFRFVCNTSIPVQTKELATRYERALQESEAATEKSKNRLDISSEELERLLLQKEGESLKDNAVQQRPAGAATGSKRAIGKAVAKGGLLLKGKNPGNVRRSNSNH